MVAADCSPAQETSPQGRRRLASSDSRNLLPKRSISCSGDPEMVAKKLTDWLQQSEENVDRKMPIAPCGHEAFFIAILLRIFMAMRMAIFCIKKVVGLNHNFNYNIWLGLATFPGRSGFLLRGLCGCRLQLCFHL